MSKKLTGNGFWESSRMMLPEHKAALVEMRKEERRRIKPNVDFDAAEEIAAAIGHSFSTKESIRIEVYNEYAERIEEGVVEKVNQHAGWIEIAGQRVKFSDIIAVK
ncbi:MAG: YolD-like family protein [Cohnella sp.]|nr:YolD-like family protein [Cohnella sp.]